MHTLVSNERQWLSVLVAINFVETTMPNSYVIQEKGPNQEFISKCENGVCMVMQDNDYVDATNFSKWIVFLVNYHETKGNLSLTKRIMLILDGHKSHITLEVLLKAKSHGIDMVSLPSHISYVL